MVTTQQWYLGGCTQGKELLCMGPRICLSGGKGNKSSPHETKLYINVKLCRKQSACDCEFSKKRHLLPHQSITWHVLVLETTLTLP